MTSRESLLSRTFVDLADTMVDSFDVLDLLTMLSGRCVDLLDVTASGILLADGQGVLHIVAASSEEAHLLELFQLQNREGPCLDAFNTGTPVNEDDLTGTGRWPSFRKAAIGAGLSSVHAFPMHVRGVTLGTMNVFSARTKSMTDDDSVVAKALADAATIAVLHDQVAREAQTVTVQLQTALDSRVTIEQAKGVLAERAKIDVGEAFSRLRRYSRNNNLRLSVVAAGLVDGSLPPDALTTLIAPADERVTSATGHSSS